MLCTYVCVCVCVCVCTTKSFCCMKGNKVKVKVARSCLTLCNPVDYAVHGIVQARILEWVVPSPGDLPNPGIEPRSPALQVDFVPAEPQGKPKNTNTNIGVCSLFLLQQIFPTQESNWGLLHCRQILYQVSYQGSHFPNKTGYLRRQTKHLT